MVDRCRAFSDSRGVSNVTFEVGVAEELNFDEGSFDAVISYDVLEHVDDPARAFTEIGRVLRPGGCAWLVFPTYLGARSAHLDYLTQVPLLHRVFAPETIIPVVNRFLAADPARYGVRPQPPPRVTAVGRRALPTLNGMSLDDAKSWLRRAGLATSWARIEPLFRPDAPLPLAGPLSRAMARAGEAGHLPEVLVWHLACKVHRT
jgi:SAM-dependent methyltransferase